MHVFSTPRVRYTPCTPPLTVIFLKNKLTNYSVTSSIDSSKDVICSYSNDSSKEQQCRNTNDRSTEQYS